jgi:SHS2 domain-containing protein
MYEFLPHTADVRIHVTAHSQEELFTEALRALCAFVNASGEGERRERAVEVAAGNATDLLVDFLNEALWRLHAYREVYDAVDFQRCTLTDLSATLHGRAFQAMAEDVKAVTYHEADVQQTPEGRWTTVLVLDV